MRSCCRESGRSPGDASSSPPRRPCARPEPRELLAHRAATGRLRQPAPRNGGPPSQDALARGWGVVTPELLPGVRLKRALNAINYRAVESEAHRAGERVGIPIVGDDQDAVRVTAELVVDAGFDPVVVGWLACASDFEIGSRVFVTNMTAADLREALGLR